MKNKITDTIKFFIGWPLALIGLILVIRLIYPNLNTIATKITDINWVLLGIGFIVFLLYFFVRSFLWKRLLDHKGYPLAFKETTFLWTTSEVKRFVPGNVWAFVGRTAAFAQKEVPASVTFGALFLEVEYVAAASFFLSLFIIPFIFSTYLPPFPYKEAAGWLLIILGTVATFLFLAGRKVLTHWMRWIPKWIHHGLPIFSFLTNCELFVISCIALFLFGLGTYFSIAAIAPLHLDHLWLFIGIYIFSFFTGYASVIAPMGLGIREVTIVAGLSKFMNAGIAGLGAILARVMIIIAEIVFLGIAVGWEKIKSKKITQATTWVTQHWQELSVGVLGLIYSAYFTTASFLRYENFYTGRFDLGNMDQVVWNTAHGRIFQFTNPDGITIISRLAFHADFLLILLSPFYFLWQDPRMLLLLQTLIVACGGIFVFLIANQILKNKTFALVFATAFFLNPSVEHANLYDFHAVVLATTFFLGAYYFLIKKKWFLYVIFLFLAALTKEQVWIITALFGILTIFKGKKILGFFITAISAAAFGYIFFYAIPHARGGAHFALSYYADLGSSPMQILTNILIHPMKVLSIVFTREKMYYLMQLFLPVGFLSFFAPLYLIFALPDLGINLLSNNAQFHQIYFQYTAVITPFVFIAAIYGVFSIQKRFLRITKEKIMMYLLCTTLLSAYFFGPVARSKKSKPRYVYQTVNISGCY